MLLTSLDIAHPHRVYEAEVLLSLLDFPGGITARGVRGRVGRMSLSLVLIEELLERLVRYKLVGYFVGSGFDDGKVFYQLAVNGWLKAATLERPYSSKDRT